MVSLISELRLNITAKDQSVMWQCLDVTVGLMPELKFNIRANNLSVMWQSTCDDEFDVWIDV